MSDKAELKALYESQGGWGEVGSAANGPRYMKAMEPSRKRPKCGCGARATHQGFANGVALTRGCEFHMAAWVRNPDVACGGEPSHD